MRKRMEPQMDADVRGSELKPQMHRCTRIHTDQKCAHGADGAQRAEVVALTWVGKQAEQEYHKKEVPGGSSMCPGTVRAGVCLKAVRGRQPAEIRLCDDDYSISLHPPLWETVPQP